MTKRDLISAGVKLIAFMSLLRGATELPCSIMNSVGNFQMYGTFGMPVMRGLLTLAAPVGSITTVIAALLILWKIKDVTQWLSDIGSTKEDAEHQPGP